MWQKKCRKDFRQILRWCFLVKNPLSSHIGFFFRKQGTRVSCSLSETSHYSVIPQVIVKSDILWIKKTIHRLSFDGNNDCSTVFCTSLPWICIYLVSEWCLCLCLADYKWYRLHHVESRLTTRIGVQGIKYN